MPSTPKEPDARVYSTSGFHLHEFVSLGVGYESVILGEVIELKTNSEEGFSAYDPQNLFMCQYLNLRHSSVVSVDLKYLPSLRYIDISFSEINKIDLLDSEHLEMIVADRSQTITVGESVVAEYIFDTRKWVYLEQVSLG